MFNKARAGLGGCSPSGYRKDQASSLLGGLINKLMSLEGNLFGPSGLPAPPL